MENTYYVQNEADSITVEEWYQITNASIMNKELAIKVLADQQHKKRMIRHNLLLKLNIRDLKQFDNRLT